MSVRSRAEKLAVADSAQRRAHLEGVLAQPARHDALALPRTGRRRSMCVPFLHSLTGRVRLTLRATLSLPIALLPQSDPVVAFG